MWQFFTLGILLFSSFSVITSQDFHTTPATHRATKSPPNKYLAHIFTRYGSRGEMSFEGLEHLMHSLGLGGLEFRPEHTVAEHLEVSQFVEVLPSEDDSRESSESSDVMANRNEIRSDLWHGVSWPEMTFKELHDPKHRHRRHHASPEETNSCLSPLRLIHTVLGSKRFPSYHAHHDDEDIAAAHLRITPLEFMEICPALVAQLDQNACPTKLPLEEKLEGSEMSRLSPILATVAILVISLCGLVGIGVVPLMKYSAYHDILHFLVALAVGTLVGDALMHLLPHAFEAQEESDDHSHASTWICFITFASTLLMYTLENLLSLVGGGHSHGPAEPQNPPNSEEIELNHHPDKKSCSGAEKPLTPLAIMVILGDGLHNLTDGLAIGSSFAADPLMGITTAFAVLCHELPHELGDFALLLKTGVSLRRVIILNILSSALSFLGMGIGLFLITIHTSAVKWVYAFTAGSFLYIGLADLVPELTHGAPSKSLKCALLAIFGILAGGLIMLVIALYEHKLVLLFN
ncbi:zinc transporter ZIP10 [Phlebotomus argentipes]|uniref:zinc transporter ZIP10 n=1 Tax=Phlebotomus argentipes TaxID=94469 RepID=UPI0028934757|nr:zinc transporter ZIP10 [Phlebotomus argentipes]